MKKINSILIILFLTASCATQNIVTNSVEETTAIVLVGDLLGLKLQVGNAFIEEIKSSDLQKDKSQMRTKTIYKRILTIPVDPGNNLITLSKEGVVVYQKQIYILKGQVRRISI